MKWSESNMFKSSLLFDKQAREKLLNGVNIMADAVSSTLGARGQNVAIARYTPKGEIYERIVLHDGVSVARAIDLPDEFENMGAQLLKEASQKQVDSVGDGTTVVMILAQAMLRECMTMIAAGVNPMSLREGLERGSDILVKQLEKMGKPIKTHQEMEYIASISAEDKILGKLVADTLEKVGVDGVITVEESKSPETTIEHQEGMQLDKGYLHDFFITNPQRMEATLENAYVLVTDRPVTTLVDMGKFLNEFVKTSKMLVIIAPDIFGEALPLLIQNKMEGKLLSLCIKAPSFGQDQKHILQDIAILTGAKFITEDAGYTFNDLTIDDLGFVEHITSTKTETVIAGGRGKAEQIKSRIKSIKKQIEGETQEFDKEKLRARLGKLTNGVAVIRVGGLTEVEMKERYERVKDAVAATRAAMQDGIVPGGEIIYLHLRKHLDTSISQQILYRALSQPFKKLLSNAGINEAEALLQLVTKDDSWGIDVIDGQAKDFLSAGIVDPLAVHREAIRNAVSVSIQLMTVGCIIIPKENTLCDQK